MDFFGDYQSVGLFLLILFILVLEIRSGHVEDREKLLERQNRFKDRESMTLEEIYQNFYFSTGLPKGEVIRLWLKAADLVEFDPKKLRPTDHSDKELVRRQYSSYSNWSFDIDMVALLVFYNKEWKALGKAGDPPKIKTLDDFIRALCSKSKVK